MATVSVSGIDERALRLLKLLVTRYIRDGQPVGSRTLSKETHVGLSSATIRNVMADLEEMGLVCSPHTSAGRIPTALGYRLFVDSLLQVKPLKNEEESELRNRLNAVAHNHGQLLEHASNLLSEFTHLAGIVMLPYHSSKALRHIEFIPLSEQRLLVILVFNEHEVENRIIQTSRNYSRSELEQAANYLNEAFAGKDIKAVRQQLLSDLQQTRRDMDEIMRVVQEFASQALDIDTQAPRDYVMAGQTNLMDVADLSDLDKLKHLFVAFNQKRDILHLLDQALEAQGIQIFIGEESGYEVLGECSVVTSPYRINGSVIGVLGVIGPTRMAYERIIPVVDVTAKMLSAALNQS